MPAFNFIGLQIEVGVVVIEIQFQAINTATRHFHSELLPRFIVRAVEAADERYTDFPFCITQSQNVLSRPRVSHPGEKRLVLSIPVAVGFLLLFEVVLLQLQLLLEQGFVHDSRCSRFFQLHQVIRIGNNVACPNHNWVFEGDAAIVSTQIDSHSKTVYASDKC